MTVPSPRTAGRVVRSLPAAGAGVDAGLEAPGETVPAEVVAAGGRHLGKGLQGPLAGQVKKTTIFRPCKWLRYQN